MMALAYHARLNKQCFAISQMSAVILGLRLQPFGLIMGNAI